MTTINRPPRHLAAEGWHHGIVRRTLYAPEHRCSAQLQGLIIDTPLHLSWQENAGKGRTVQLNFTLCRWTREKNGADKVAFNDRGDTPLFYSSCCGYTQAVTGRGTHLGRPCQHEHGHKHGSQWFRSLLTHAARGEILEQGADVRSVVELPAFGPSIEPPRIGRLTTTFMHCSAAGRIFK